MADADGDAGAQRLQQTLSALLGGAARATKVAAAASAPAPDGTAAPRKSILKSPVLAASRKRAQEELSLAEAKRRRRAEMERAKVRRALQERGHVLPQFDDLEKRLVRVATKGVVRLYNTVAQKQRERQVVEARAKGDTAAAARVATEDVSRDGFLRMLQDGGAVSVKVKVEPPPGEAKAELGADAAGGEQKRAGGGGWKILRDDFMMGARIKDWDRSESDEDAEEAPEEAGVEPEAVLGGDERVDAEASDA